MMYSQCHHVSLVKPRSSLFHGRHFDDKVGKEIRLTQKRRMSSSTSKGGHVDRRAAPLDEELLYAAGQSLVVFAVQITDWDVFVCDFCHRVELSYQRLRFDLGGPVLLFVDRQVLVKDLFGVDWDTDSVFLYTKESMNVSNQRLQFLFFFVFRFLVLTAKVSGVGFWVEGILLTSILRNGAGSPPSG